MEKKLPKHNTNVQSPRPKSKCKPYWCDELQSAWDQVRVKERAWLRSMGNQSEKRRLRSAYVQERETFDILNRRSKRKYQCAEHDRLKELFNDQETRNFWKYIGKIGMQNDRKPCIPMEIVDSNGHVSTQTEEVLSRWKADYEHLFCEKSNTNFDDTHLRNIQSALRDNHYHAHNADMSILNAEITKSEIEKSILRAKTLYVLSCYITL